MLEFVLAGKVPGGLGCEGQENGEEEDEEELGGEGSTVGPAIGSFSKGLDNCVGQELANGDAQVNTSCGISSEGDGSQLTACEGCKRKVETESQAEDQLGAEESCPGI